MPDAELLATLRQVFQHRQPNPESSAYMKSVYYLGTAWQTLESDLDEPKRWSDWTHIAVAYSGDADAPMQNFGPDHGFCQFCTCCGCGTPLRSNLKRAICPVCGEINSLT